MRLLCITVIYKRELSKTEAYRTILSKAAEREDTGIFIYDNSPEAPLTMEHYRKQGWEYRWDPSNGGVSKAYNEGAAYAKANGFDRLLLLDQDTDWEVGNYVETLFKAVSENADCDIFVPRITYGKGIFSPLRCKGFRPSGETFPFGENILKNVAIVNSGLSLTTSLFHRAGGYNEKVALDFADFQFIRRLERHTDRFFLIDYSCRQDFSDNTENREALWSRFLIYSRCIRNYECRDLSEKTRLFTAGLSHSMKLSLRTRSFKFLSHFLSSFPKTSKVW